MNDFVSRILATDATPAVRPLLPYLFEPGLELRTQPVAYDSMTPRTLDVHRPPDSDLGTTPSTRIESTNTPAISGRLIAHRPMPPSQPTTDPLLPTAAVPDADRHAAPSYSASAVPDSHGTAAIDARRIVAARRPSAAHSMEVPPTHSPTVPPTRPVATDGAPPTARTDDPVLSRERFARSVAMRRPAEMGHSAPSPHRATVTSEAPRNHPVGRPLAPATSVVTVSSHAPEGQDLPRRREPVEQRTVHITIGRVEVRGAQPSAPPAPQREVRRQPLLSLQGYLEQRAGGERR
jgi:hypothetical protein